MGKKPYLSKKLFFANGVKEESNELNSNAIDGLDHVTASNKRDTRESRNPFSRGLGEYYYLIPDFKDVMLESL
jgi:hypothetical protein